MLGSEKYHVLLLAKKRFCELLVLWHYLHSLKFERRNQRFGKVSKEFIFEYHNAMYNAEYADLPIHMNDDEANRAERSVSFQHPIFQEV